MSEIGCGWRVADFVGRDLAGFLRCNAQSRFGEDNLERTISETIVMSNQGNGPARFQWISSSPGHFGLSTTEGIIRPGQSMTLEVIKGVVFFLQTISRL